MKKALLSLILTVIIASAYAQPPDSYTNSAATSKWPASAVLPEAHDWSIGFDVVPVIEAAGDLFHAPAGNDSIFSQQQYTLVGLYVKDDKTSYRLRVRIGLSSAKFNNLVTDDVNPTTQLTDTWTQNMWNITLGAGIQKNTGKRRLRGIYGYEAAIQLGKTTNTLTYGNPFTPTDQTPTSTDFTKPLSTGGFTYAATANRPTSSSDGTMFAIQINGFIGVEYFFAPKMSLSAEYAWGLGYASVGEATTTYDSWTGGSGGNETFTPVTIGSASAFKLDVQDATSIILHVYF